jgi:predicted aldo/keto reductase-like oxidoreductase
VGIVDDPRTIAAAFEAGINFFFVTTDMHWPLYEGTRRGLRALFRTAGVRDQVVVAGVCYPTQPEFNRMPFEELIDAVPGMARVDVAVMGGVYAHDVIARLPVYQEQRAARTHGIRAIGASFHDRRAVPPTVNHGLVDVGFIRYNPAHPGAREDTFPVLEGQDRTTPLFNFTNTSGFVAPKRRRELRVPANIWQPHVTDCYRFALSEPAIAGLLCAPRTPRELQGLTDALTKGPLSTEEQNILINLARLDAGDAELA